ncbi:MAG: alpha/beta fold hydrolase [Candidatus Sericytochromatia bacterium]
MKKYKFKKINFIYPLIAVLIGCSNIADNSEISSKSSIQSNEDTLSPNTIKVWEEHLSQVKYSGEIQKGCEPILKKAEGKALGSVVLFHGYSACPQQFNKIADILAKKNYNVFVPLLPGHGKTQVKVSGKLIDDSSGLPETSSVYLYDNFAHSIGALLKDEQGSKVVSGLSVGGVVATKVMLDYPEVYDRGILFAPFFNASGVLSALIPAVNTIVPNKRMSWGNECEFKRTLGRAGYCDFKIENIAAARKFGTETLKHVSLIKKPIQIVGVESDPAASNSAIADAVKNMPNSKGCFLEKGTPHSMLSKEDNPTNPMFWLKPVEDQLVDFVSTGKNFVEVGKSQHNLGLCKSS